MTTPKYHRVLALAPTSRGLGYAVLEDRDILVDWGVKSVSGDKNIQSLAKAKAVLALYHPEILILEEASAGEPPRASRIQELSRQIAETAQAQNIEVVVVSRKEVGRALLPGQKRTKQAVAERLARQFPEELGNRLPPKRRPWMSQDYRMDIFDAVALAVGFRLMKSKRNGNPKEKVNR